jgi:hypothetical protein
MKLSLLFSGHFEAVHSQGWTTGLAFSPAVRGDLDDFVEHLQHFKGGSQRCRSPGSQSLLCPGRSVDHGHVAADNVPPDSRTSHSGFYSLAF